MRAWAILSVLAMHVNEYYMSSGLDLTLANKLPPFRGGWVGVPLFFVLSGYLIGGQIWKEFLGTKTINFGRFILRRGFRIWPLYYFILILFYFFRTGESTELGLISNILFLSNYWQDSGPILGAWSLATEEHFYIIGPLFIIFFGKLKKVRNLLFFRRCLWIMFFVPIITRFLTWKYLAPDGEFDLNLYMQAIYRPIHTNCEGLIIGMIIANYVQDNTFKVSNFFNHRRSLICLISFAVMAISFKSKVILNFTGVAIGFGSLLWLSFDPKNIVTKFLAHPIWFPIAKTSFATYLIHIPIVKMISTQNQLLVKAFPIFLIPFVVLLLTTIICIAFGAILYILIEKPFLILRNKVMS
jgi:peptidoglycan/LPS O-acetylase OafA/YrhL